MPPHYIEVLVTPLYRVRRTNFLESVLGPPLSLFSASQRMRGAHHLFAHMRPLVAVQTQADPMNLHIFHPDVLVMKNKSKKDLRWLLLELLKSCKILFTVQPKMHISWLQLPLYFLS